MRDATEEDGETPKFHVDEWLSEDQIKYLFSRFASEIKKGPKKKPLVEEQDENSGISEEESDEVFFEKEEEEAEDDEDENFFLAASEGALLKDIPLQALEDPDGSEHPLMVRIVNKEVFLMSQ